MGTANCADPCSQSAATTSGSAVAVYNVRFPANICEHQSPSFVRRPAPLPGRGGGAVVVVAEQPVRRPSPKRTARKPGPRGTKTAAASTSKEKQEPRPSRKLTAVEPATPPNSMMSSSEVKVAKRDAKHRYTNNDK